jgi:hypothetical protein
MLLARVTVLSVALAMIAAIAGASSCAGDDAAAADPPSPDSGIDPALEPATGVCPMTAPKSGEKCLLPEGTTCAFACGTAIVQCSLGLWRYAGNPPPQPPCPEPEPPAPESDCPPCWPAGATCTYGSADCSSSDASTSRALASCANNKWKIQFSPCAATDAGADVQGDAGADAD